MLWWGILGSSLCEMLAATVDGARVVAGEYEARLRKIGSRLENRAANTKV
jgi:hypothetical protein